MRLSGWEWGTSLFGSHENIKAYEIDEVLEEVKGFETRDSHLNMRKILLGEIRISM